MHPVFIAALFTIARIWKQPKCLSTDVSTVDMVCTHIKTNTTLPSEAIWMDFEIIILSEGRGRYILYDTAYNQNLKLNDTNEFIYKRNSLIVIENEYSHQRGEEGRDKLGLGLGDRNYYI